MINLPNDWRHGIQVKDMTSDKDSQTIGVLILLLINESQQIFGYEIPVMVPYYLLDDLNKHEFITFYDVAFNTLISNAQEVVMNMDNAFGRDDNDELEVQVISDQNWEVFWNENLVPYDDFVTNLTGEKV